MGKDFRWHARQKINSNIPDNFDDSAGLDVSEICYMLDLNNLSFAKQTAYDLEEHLTKFHRKRNTCTPRGPSQ